MKRFLSNLIKTISSESGDQNIMWNTLSKSEEFQAILKRSIKTPQLIYKHSPSCSVSFLSKQDLDSSTEKLSEIAELHIIDVIQQRELSNAIASELRIRHESPQGLLIKDGEVLWHRSHWKVTSEEILSKIG
jgi:bacillithiol system protein YtxJ